jgi:predicted ester cyclase
MTRFSSVANLARVAAAEPAENAQRDVACSPLAALARRWIGPFRDSFPDFRIEIVDLVADREKVAAHFRCSGTHLGEWLGHPPTGRRFTNVDEIYIFQIRDGKLAGAFGIEDNLTRVRQLGLNTTSPSLHSQPSRPA